MRTRTTTASGQAGGECTLGRACGTQGITGTRKNRKQRIALGIDLVTAIYGSGTAAGDTPLTAQRSALQLLEQVRGTSISVEEQRSVPVGKSRIRHPLPLQMTALSSCVMPWYPLSSSLSLAIGMRRSSPRMELFMRCLKISRFSRME
jgi:hypothetical protein